MNFSPQQSQLIFNIASQCPLGGGNAVFRARSLYSLIDKTIHFINFDICLQAGIVIRQKSEVNSQSLMVKVYPNPANELLIVDYEIPDTDTGIFTVINSTGQKIIELKLTGGKNNRLVTTQEIIPGAYYYTFISNNYGVKNGKVIVVR